MAADWHDANAGLSAVVSVEQTWHFDGTLADVSEARHWAGDFLCGLARMHPPAAPHAHADALLVITELASNAFTYAPGPFALNLQAMMADTLHIAMTDTNPAPPTARPRDPSGNGGLGWHLINALAHETITVPGTGDIGGKTVHAFLPW
ncbi:ATP-binding protein [Streptomyces sp. NPDC054887]